MLNSFLYQIDLFGVPVTMNFLGRSKIKSKVGGLFTLLYFGFTIWALYTASKDMFSLSNPITISSETHDENPQEMIISKESFPLAFQIKSADQPHFYNESIYKLKIYSSIRQRITYENGTKGAIETKIDLVTEPCRPEYFEEKAHLFSKIIEQGAVCVSQTQPNLDKIRLQGIYDSPIYKSLNFEILKCRDSESSVPCASQDVINNLLSKSSLNIYYANLVMTPHNYSYPDCRYLDSHYKLIKPNEYQESSVSLEHMIMENDIGWISENIETHKYIKVHKVIESSQTISSSENLLVRIIFEVGTLKSNYSRTYKKVQQVLAEAGSITGSFIVIIGIIICPYANLKYKESVMNELFDTSPSSIENSSKKNRQNKKKKYKITMANQEQDNLRQKDVKRDGSLIKTISINNESIQCAEKPKNKIEKYKTKENQGNKLSSSNIYLLNLSSSPESSKTTSEVKGLCEHLKNELNNNKQSELEITNQSNQKIEPNQSKKFHVDEDAPQVLEALVDKKGKTQKFNKEDSSDEEEGKNNIKINVSDSEANARNILNKENEVKANEQNILGSSLRKSRESLHANEIIEKDAEIVEIKQEELLSEDEEENNGEEKDASSLKVPDFDTEKTGSKKLELSPWEYFSSLFYKSKAVKAKMKILSKGIKNIEMRLDMLNIMKQMREIEKLRALILGPEQLILFNNLPKPKLNDENVYYCPKEGEKDPSKQLVKMPTFVEISSKEDLVRAYKKVKQKECKTEIDQKLLSLFDDHFF